LSPSDPQDQQSYWNENLDPQNIGASFDTTAYDYDRELMFYLAPDQVHVLRQFGALEGKRVLEVGAGIGTNALYLAGRGATVFAIDIAQDRLKTLRQLSDRLRTEGRLAPDGRIIPIKCSAEALPFRDDVFDHQFSKSVLLHTRLEEASRELGRTLRPGSFAVFVEPLTRNPFVNLYRATFAPKIWKQIARYFTDVEIGILGSAYSRCSYERFYLFAFLAFIWQYAVQAPTLFRISMAVLHRFDRVLFALCPPLKKLAWFAAIRVEK
jgi:SAM-dependent methyltransferase